jgi:hypothetical protein
MALGSSAGAIAFATMQQQTTSETFATNSVAAVTIVTAKPHLFAARTAAVGKGKHRSKTVAFAAKAGSRVASTCFDPKKYRSASNSKGAAAGVKSCYTRFAAASHVRKPKKAVVRLAQDAPATLNSYSVEVSSAPPVVASSDTTAPAATQSGGWFKPITDVMP